MELEAFEVEVRAKSERDYLKMTFFVKITLFLLFNCFRVNQMGFEQVFYDLTFKRMDGFSKQIQSLVD